MSGGRSLSTRLRVRDVQRVDDAVLISLRIGKWFNRSITIQLATARLGSDDDAHLFLQHFLKLARDWLAKRGAGPICYVTVFEGKGGFHAHILMHVPIGLWRDFRSAEKLWLKRCLLRFKGERSSEVIHDRAVIYYEQFLRGEMSERAYLEKLRGALLYRLKGATRMDTARYLGLDGDEIESLTHKMLPSYQGVVMGRRVSVSHSLLLRAGAPPLHPNPKLTWLDDAGRELEAGRALHQATLALGNPLPGVAVASKTRSLRRTA